MWVWKVSVSDSSVGIVEITVILNLVGFLRITLNIARFVPGTLVFRVMNNEIVLCPNLVDQLLLARNPDRVYLKKSKCILKGGSETKPSCPNEVEVTSSACRTVKSVRRVKIEILGKVLPLTHFEGELL